MSDTPPMEEFGLINVVDRVLPGGSIMAGEAPWFRKPKKEAAQVK